MEAIIIISAIAALAGLVWFLKKRNVKPVWYKNPLNRGLGLVVSTQPEVTPDGVKVYHEPGAKRVPHASIDAGFRRVFERAANHYPVDRSVFDLRVTVLQGERAPESGDWAIRVPMHPDNPYYNGEWDMMRGSKDEIHYLLAAAMVLTMEQQYGHTIAIPDADDPNYIETICDYEGEHLILAQYDSPKYEATAVHGSGQGHPVIE